MNVVDSSRWIEYFADGPAADFFAPAIERPAQLVVPSLTLFEVFRRILRQRDENAALTAVALMQQGAVADLSAPIALSAAAVSVRHKLPMADSVIYATARAHDAVVWTMDADFANLPHVKYRPARR